jgi:hypothetical protein
VAHSVPDPRAVLEDLFDALALLHPLDLILGEIGDRAVALGLDAVDLLL